MENLKIFEYRDMPISFITNDEGEPMVNATEMAKAFGKNIKHWFENQSTIDYITSYVELKGIKVIGGNPLSTFNTTSVSKRYPSLINVVRGHFSDNRKQGTFLCRGLSIEFARWLSPAFAIWCDERILEYLRFGFTATNDTLHRMRNDPAYIQQVADEFEAMRDKNRELEVQNLQLSKKLEEDAPKVNFYNNVTTINETARKQKTFTISKIASRLKSNSQYLNKLLINKKVIVRVDNGYDIHPQYEDADIGVTKIVNAPKRDSEGEITEYVQQYVTYTHKGVALIEDLLRQNPQQQEAKKS